MDESLFLATIFGSSSYQILVAWQAVARKTRPCSESLPSVEKMINKSKNRRHNMYVPTTPVKKNFRMSDCADLSAVGGFRKSDHGDNRSSCSKATNKRPRQVCNPGEAQKNISLGFLFLRVQRSEVKINNSLLRTREHVQRRRGIALILCVSNALSLE